MDANIESDSGIFEVHYSENGSRGGDFFLNTIDKHTFRSALYPTCIRLPIIGGGLRPATHAALTDILKNAPLTADAQSVCRARKPVVLLGDDFSIDGGFSYLEIRSDEDGFLCEVRDVNIIEATSGPVRFSDAQSVAKLAHLYNGVSKDQKSMLERLRYEFEAGKGYMVDNISPKAWDEAMRYRADFGQEGAEGHLQKIKETGIFLLKLGIDLPKEIHDSWMAEFGALPEVLALSGKAR